MVPQHACGDKAAQGAPGSHVLLRPPAQSLDSVACVLTLGCCASHVLSSNWLNCSLIFSACEVFFKITDAKMQEKGHCSIFLILPNIVKSWQEEILVLSSVLLKYGLRDLSHQNEAGKPDNIWMLGSGLRPHSHTQNLGFPLSVKVLLLWSVYLLFCGSVARWFCSSMVLWIYNLWVCGSTDLWIWGFMWFCGSMDL